MPLTADKIKAIQPDTYTRDHHDGDGLVLRVTPAGGMTWAVIYYEQDPDTGKSRKRRTRIGRYPDLGLRAARADRDRIKGRLAGRNAITMAAFAEEYLEGVRPKKKSWKEDERILRKDVLPVIGKRPVAEITRRECAQVLDRIRDRGAHDMARRSYAVLRRVLQVAMDRGIIESNPAQRMGGILAGGKARDRVLHASELAAWWRAVNSEQIPELPRLALTFVVATGQRLGEVLEMEPADLELIDGRWIIPAAKAKNGVSHTVPLTQWARAVLDQARRLHPDASHVFPVSADTVRTYMRQAVTAAKIPRATPHDLRRTVATHLGGLGHNRQIQDKLLNHVDQSVGAIYDQYSYDNEKRAALEDWAAEFTRITREGAA